MAQSVLDLAAAVSRGANALNVLYKQNNLEAPSHFKEPEAVESSEPFVKAKNEILDAAIELYDLLVSPAQMLRLYSGTANTIALHFVHRFKIAEIVPTSGTISFEEIALQCKQPKRDVVRLLRHAMSIRLFDEPEDGLIRHTRQSLLLRTDAFYNRVGGSVEDSWVAATKMIDAMAQFPGSDSPNESGYALSQPDRISFYDHMAANQDHSDRFTKGRQSYSVDHKPEIAQLVSVCHSFEALQTGGTMVDIGGASGWVSMKLSQEFPNAKFVVEDLASVIATRENSTLTNGHSSPVDLSKIEFVAHDFFMPQPVHGAAVYYMRWILHNHGDTPAIRILQNLAPAMTSGSKLFIHDYVMDGFAEMQHKSIVDKRMTSSMDIGMQMLFNARERTAEDWEELLTKADKRFKMVNITRAEGSSLGLIEVVWE